MGASPDLRLNPALVISPAMAGYLPLCPDEPNTRLPFWCPSPGSSAVPAASRPRGGWLSSRGRSAGRTSRSLSRRRRRGLGRIPAGICRADRGNSSKPGIKTQSLFRCSDSDRRLLPFTVVLCFMGTTVRTADGNKHSHSLQKHIRHFRIRNLHQKSPQWNSTPVTRL